MVIVPDTAKLLTLTDLLALYDVYIHLYVYDLPLDADTTLADLTGREAGYPGYAPIQATGWSEPEIVEGRAVSVANICTFVRGTGGLQQDVYGYFATNGVSGPLLWCERGAAPPYPMRAAGDQVAVMPGAAMRGQQSGSAYPA